jgi:hypothetical protein
MSIAAHMNRYETCIACGGQTLNGMPCPCQGVDLPYDWMPVHERTSPSIPVPVDRKHAKMMILVAEQYLADNP